MDHYPLPVRSMICSQCLVLRGEFNRWRPADGMPRRLLADMMVLADADRQRHSYLCGGPERMHPPTFMAVVDQQVHSHHGLLPCSITHTVQVVPMDFHCLPPDRFHWATNATSNQMKVLKAHFAHTKQTKVTACR